MQRAAHFVLSFLQVREIRDGGDSYVAAIFAAPLFAASLCIQTLGRLRGGLAPRLICP